MDGDKKRASRGVLVFAKCRVFGGLGFHLLFASSLVIIMPPDAAFSRISIACYL